MSLNGTVVPPGDKSISHRVVLFSLTSVGTVRVENLSPCDDVMSSLAAAKALGMRVEKDGDEYVFKGLEGNLKDFAEIDCGNSGTTIRIIMGVLAGCRGTFVLDGDKYLRRRPMERVAIPLRKMGAQVSTTNDRCPVTVKGGDLTGIEYDLPVASAQLKSACLMAGIRAEGQTIITEPGHSRDHTERLIRSWGGAIAVDGRKVTVSGSSLNLPKTFLVPGDSSSAAFFLVAASVIPGSRVTTDKVLLNPTRTGFIKVLERMGANLTVQVLGEDPEPWGRITAEYSPYLKGTTVTGAEIPGLVDEVPILSLAAVMAEGQTVFEDAGELRIKETDRLAAVESELGKMGADIKADGDRLVINGGKPLSAPESGLDSFGDHRMAMTLRLALTACGRDAAIAEEECAGVSYPTFQAHLKALSS